MNPDKDLILKLIAEGYYHDTKADRYILILNPDYRVDDGSDPFIIYDVKINENDLTSDH